MLFLLINLITNFIFSKSEKLIFTELLSRHGARAPLILNENGKDLLGNQWPAPGELTPIGKRMEYLLGLRNRERYIKSNDTFLSEIFDPHELVVFSSDINRTLISIQSQLQGLYPISSEISDIINPDQNETSVPPINLSGIVDDLINGTSLPNGMTIIPIHFIALKNTTTECQSKIKEFNIFNSKNKKEIIDLVNEFNKNYSQVLNSRYNKSENHQYNMSLINSICDTAIADNTEGKNITDFLADINAEKESFMKMCYDVLKINFRDYIFGDDNNEVILFYNSLIFRDMLKYMQAKIEDDIKGDINKNNVSDYNTPKMVILSGHDTTLSAHEMFFIKFFKLDLSSYEYPKYTSQISYEITREDVDENLRSSLNFSNYWVQYYFNDELLLNITFDEFKQTIEENIWKNERMDEFCFGKKEKPFMELDLIIIISLGALIFILVIVVIILFSKLKKTKKDDVRLNSADDNRLIEDDKVIDEDDNV
jgi:hypothetical protein